MSKPQRSAVLASASVSASRVRSCSAVEMPARWISQKMSNFTGVLLHSVSQDGNRIDRRTGTALDAQRRDHKLKFPPPRRSAGLCEISQVQVIQQVQTHRDKTAHVHWDWPIFDWLRRRRGIIDAVAAQHRDAALVQPRDAVWRQPCETGISSSLRGMSCTMGIPPDIDEQNVAF